MSTPLEILTKRKNSISAKLNHAKDVLANKEASVLAVKCANMDILINEPKLQSVLAEFESLDFAVEYAELKQAEKKAKKESKNLQRVKKAQEKAIRLNLELFGVVGEFVTKNTVQAIGNNDQKVKNQK